MGTFELLRRCCPRQLRLAVDAREPHLRASLPDAERRSNDWRVQADSRLARLFEQDQHAGTDEREFYNVFRGRTAKVASWLGRDQPRCLFREAYSTPAPHADIRWNWKDGRLTNEFYPHNDFMYLHFMNWHSNRWYADQPGCSPDLSPPWSTLSRLVQTDWTAARRRGFRSVRRASCLSMMKLSLVSAPATSERRPFEHPMTQPGPPRPRRAPQGSPSRWSRARNEPSGAVPFLMPRMQWFQRWTATVRWLITSSSAASGSSIQSARSHGTG